MKINLVNFKAFGDFVIASSAIRSINLDDVELPKIIAGEHVRSLASALKLENLVYFVGDENWRDVPAAFDVRKHGAYAGLKSIFEIRRLLKATPAGSQLIFDRLGWRERFIGYGFQLHELSENDGNIYIAYDNLLQSLGFEVDAEFHSARRINKTIIIPGARMSHRIIPAQVISTYVHELARRNIQTEVVVLEGESIDIPSDVNLRIIPRKFGVLIEEISNSDLVISADSLPSHLSEYLHVPIFVSTPAPKTYWLPRSSYKTTGWATFSDIQSFKIWLEENFHL